MTLRIIFLATLIFFSCGCNQQSHAAPKRGESVVANWPPKLGVTYPNLQIIDHKGKTHRIADFRGKPLLIELTAFPCAGCQAFSGAHKHGAFGKVRPQKGLKSFEEYLPRFGNGLKISDSRFTFMQLLLYDFKMGTPSKKDAAAWAKHFEFNKLKNTFIVAPTGKRPTNSYNLIPGFHLLDKNSILLSDSSGHNPKHNLFQELIPKLANIVLSK